MWNREKLKEHKHYSTHTHINTDQLYTAVEAGRWRGSDTTDVSDKYL